MVLVRVLLVLVFTGALLQEGVVPGSGATSTTNNQNQNNIVFPPATKPNQGVTMADAAFGGGPVGGVCPQGSVPLGGPTLAETCYTDRDCQRKADGTFCVPTKESTVAELLNEGWAAGYCCFPTAFPSSSEGTPSSSAPSQSGAVRFGTSCTEHTQCLGFSPEAECRQNHCYCRDGFRYDHVRGQCIPFTPAHQRPQQWEREGYAAWLREQQQLGGGGQGQPVPSQQNFPGGTVFPPMTPVQVQQPPQTLQIINQPQLQPQQQTFTVCPNGYIQIQGNCYRTVGYAEPCDFSAQCFYQGTVCLQSRCVCWPGFQWNGFSCAATTPNAGAVVGGGGGSVQQQQQHQVQPPAQTPTYWTAGAVPCAANTVYVGNACWPMRALAQPCVYTEQCVLPTPGVYQCLNYICSASYPAVASQIPTTTTIAIYPTFYEQPQQQHALPQCHVRGHRVELQRDVYGREVGPGPKNCLQERCFPGFDCEWNDAWRQYICCGRPLSHPAQTQQQQIPPGGGTTPEEYGVPKPHPDPVYGGRPMSCNAPNDCLYQDFPYCVFSPRNGYKVCCTKSKCL